MNRGYVYLLSLLITLRQSYSYMYSAFSYIIYVAKWYVAKSSNFYGMYLNGKSYQQAQ